VKEQSHKDEMSAAIRGDFARLRDRGVAATLVPHEAPATEPDAPEATDTAGEDGAEQPLEDASIDPELESAEQERRGWLSRLVGR
jgi:hypothetical protein